MMPTRDRTAAADARHHLEEMIVKLYLALVATWLLATPTLALAQPASGAPTSPKALSSVEQVLEANYDRFNAHDLEGLLALYADDAVATDLEGNVILRGKAAFRENFIKSFKLGPQAKAWHLKTLVVGDVIAAHEAGEIGPGQGRIELMLVVRVKDGKIVSMAAGPRSPL
jgi:hypothetical protein